MVIAKTYMRRLTYENSFMIELDRRYQALVWGDIKKMKVKLKENIWRSLKNRKNNGCISEGDIGKTAITNFKVLKRFGYVTLVEYKLDTGKTHQIRVHSKWTGHPCLTMQTMVEIDFEKELLLQNTNNL